MAWRLSCLRAPPSPPPRPRSAPDEALLSLVARATAPRHRAEPCLAEFARRQSIRSRGWPVAKGRWRWAVSGESFAADFMAAAASESALRRASTCAGGTVPSRAVGRWP